MRIQSWKAPNQLKNVLAVDSESFTRTNSVPYAAAFDPVSGFCLKSNRDVTDEQIKFV